MSCSLEKAIGDALRFLPGVVAGPVFILAVARDLGLDLKDIGLNGGGTTHAPQQRCKPEHRLALHRSSSLVIRDDRRFECLIVFVPSRATTTVSAVNRCPLRATTNPSGWCSLVMNMSPSQRQTTTCGECATSLTILASVHSTHGSTRGINNGPNPRKGRCCGSSAGFCARDCDHWSGNNIRGSS